MSAELKPPRGRRGGIILAVILVVAAIVAAAVVYSSSSSTDTTSPTESQSTSATPSDADAADPDAQPTGCLGGSARDADMLLAAQAAAPHTTTGAVEVAAAMVRWVQRSPLPTADEAVRVQDAVLTKDRAFTADLPSYLAGDPDFRYGLFADDQDFYMRTINGVWLLDSATSDAVTVSLGLNYVIDGALSPRYVVSLTMEMLWEDGHWHVGDAYGKRTTETLFAAGTPFTEGC